MRPNLRQVLLVVSTFLAVSILLHTGILRPMGTSEFYIQPPSESDLLPNAQKTGPRVLLLAYMRTGSTFVSELLSLHSSVNYLFEPLWQFRDSHLVLDSEEIQFSAARFLTALSRCDPLLTPESAALKTVNRVRFDLSECHRKPMLQKAIRVHGNTVLMMMKMDPQLKVIHLIRDPRAVALSRANVGANPSAKYYCEEIREDLDIFDTLEQQKLDRYTVVKYENLADQTSAMSEMYRLHTFMGIPLPTEEMKNYFTSHYSNKGNESKYGTKKRPDYNPNIWQRKLTSDQIRQAEDVCSDVMLRFGYKAYHA